MARIIKDSWVRALKALDSGAEIRWNTQVSRYEFSLTSADGVLRSQFWGWFYRLDGKGNRVPIQPDPATGLYPFRDLDDAAMAEALANLEQTFVGNRHDGAGTTRKEVQRRYQFNQDHMRRQYRHAGELYADVMMEHAPKIRGRALEPVLVDLHGAPASSGANQKEPV